MADSVPGFARILIIGAHPDDAEFHAGGLMVLQAARRSRIGILSLTDGSRGHHLQDRTTLAARRHLEAQASARLLGAEVQIWDEADGELTPTVELRKRLVRDIRTFAPDLVVTHRPYDYHPDHRATAQLVQDACYLLRVPNFEPSVPALAEDPVVLSMADFFTRPVRFQPDLVLSIDEVLDQVVALLDCHASQVYEWLPFVNAVTVEGDRIHWLKNYYGTRPAALARRHLPDHSFAEAYELSEYGQRMPLDEIAMRLGALTTPPPS